MIDNGSLSTLGIPGLIAVVGILSSLCIFLYRDGQKKQSKIDSMYEQQVTDAKTYRDKWSEPMKELTTMSGKMYDLLLIINNRKG